MEHQECSPVDGGIRCYPLAKSSHCYRGVALCKANFEAIVAEFPVRDLNFDLKRLQAAHDDGSHGTRAARSYALAQIG